MRCGEDDFIQSVHECKHPKFYFTYCNQSLKNVTMVCNQGRKCCCPWILHSLPIRITCHGKEHRLLTINQSTTHNHAQYLAYILGVFGLTGIEVIVEYLVDVYSSIRYIIATRLKQYHITSHHIFYR